MFGLYILSLMILKLTLMSIGLTSGQNPDQICWTNRTNQPMEIRTCLDKYRVLPDHPYCANTTNIPRVTLHMDNTDMSDIENKLNQIRADVQPPAANMMRLTYVRALQSYATKRVQLCVLNQVSWLSRFRPGAYFVGETMYISDSKLNWSDVIDQWEAEKAYFNYSVPGNNVQLVGNYTQIIAARSTTVGCAVNTCGSKFLFVCFFTQGMQPEDVDTPYRNSSSGKYGEACPSKANGTNLCDCNEVTCLNGAKLQEDTCVCTCLSSVKSFNDIVCTLECEKDGDDPRCGQPPYTIQNCTGHPDTIFHCPWMCNMCPYAGHEYKQGSALLPWEVGLPNCDDMTTVASTSSGSTTSTKTSSITTVTSDATSTTPSTNTSSTDANSSGRNGTNSASRKCRWKRWQPNNIGSRPSLSIVYLYSVMCTLVMFVTRVKI